MSSFKVIIFQNIGHRGIFAVRAEMRYTGIAMLFQFTILYRLQWVNKWLNVDLKWSFHNLLCYSKYLIDLPYTDELQYISSLYICWNVRLWSEKKYERLSITPVDIFKSYSTSLWMITARIYWALLRGEVIQHVSYRLCFEVFTTSTDFWHAWWYFCILKLISEEKKIYIALIY